VALSRKQKTLLSERLRENEVASATDLGHLEEVLLESNSALEEVAGALRQLGLEPTTRLKTSATIIDKLRRQPHLSLASIRDLAGARIVRPMTLDEQDDLAGQIRSIWPDATLIDRRIEPSYGYRAVHVVPRLNRCSVEIQLRTTTRTSGHRRWRHTETDGAGKSGTGENRSSRMLISRRSLTP
jgi:ppGpp synthetase/RelA/SpoT-type nucleotidyltranferase